MNEAGHVEAFSEAEMARLLRIPLTTLRGWRRNGLAPPAIVVMGLVRYPAAAFREWLDNEMKRAEAPRKRIVPAGDERSLP